METYKCEGKSYEDTKLRALIAILKTLGIDVEDDGYTTNIKKDGKLVASFVISL